MTSESETPGTEQPREPLELPYAKWRAGVIVGVICLLFVGVMGKAYHLQIRRADELTARADIQLNGRITITARRGAIYDRDGEEMAVSVRAESIFARPAQVESPSETAILLARVLHLNEADILAELTSDSGFRWLARRVSPQAALEIREMDLAGIDSMSEWQRFYPMRYRAGHVLGFTGDDGNGLEGVETTFNELLTGDTMEVDAIRDAHGTPILSQDAPTLAEMEGQSLVLTIDSSIQRVAEREIERAVIEHGARTGVAVVMDPHTGEILAATNWPPFDPNTFRSHRPSDWRNRTVTDAWEPGSTYKILTYAAALQAGVITPETEIDCSNGRLRIGRTRIRDTHRDGIVPAWRVIQASSNIGAYRMAELVGEEGMYDYYRQFGIGQVTGLSLGGEQRGILAEPPWAEIELANRAFGQGITTTPMQMALAISVIANGGDLMRPMLLGEVRDKDGEVQAVHEPTVVRTVVSERVAQQVTDAMILVTQEGGTGTNAALPGILVAGKTGTAQKVDPATGAYGDFWMGSFVGFVPADDPMFTIVVMIDEPQGSHYGGDVAAPAFARIAEYALRTRGVFVEWPTDEASPVAEIVGASQPIGPTEPGDIHLGVGGRNRVPDFAEMNLLTAIQTAQAAGVEIESHDWGLVRHQWPAPGANVLPGTTVEVYFQSPYEARLEGASGGQSEL